MNSYSQNTLSELNQIQQQGQTGGNAVAPKSIYFGLDSIGDVTEIDRANAVTIGPYQSGPAYSVLSYSTTTGLLTEINHEHMGTSLDDLAYTYDPLARVQTYATIDGTATYGYDPTSQLTSTTYAAASGHTEPPNSSITFDPNGNRTSANGTSTTVGADNHLTNDGTFTFTYDGAGNVSTRTRISDTAANDYKTVYDWDYRNRLTDVYFYNNSGTLTQHVHYVYDVWDELIERDLDPNGSGTYTQIVHYVWDGGENGPGQGNIVLAFSGSQQLTARYLNGPNTSAFDQYYTALAEEDVTSPTSPGTVTYPLLDDAGSVTDIVDVNGVLLDHIVSEANGALFSESNPSVTHIGTFQGGYFDPVTGFVKLGERWLNTFDATWTSPDPIGLAGDENLSRFANNDAINVADPTGLEKVVIETSHGGGDPSKNDRGFGQPTQEVPDQGPLQNGVTGKFSQSGDSGSVTIYLKGDDTCNTISGEKGEYYPSLRVKDGTNAGGMLTAYLEGYPSGTYKVKVRWNATLTSSCTSQPVRLMGLWVVTPGASGAWKSKKVTGDPSPGATLNKPVALGGTITVTVRVRGGKKTPVFQLEPGSIRGRNDDPPPGSPVGTPGATCTTVYSATLDVLSVIPVIPPRPRKVKPAEPPPEPRPLTPFGPYPATPGGFPPGTHGV